VTIQLGDDFSGTAEPTLQPQFVLFLCRPRTTEFENPVVNRTDRQRLGDHLDQYRMQLFDLREGSFTEGKSH
jgi:hypothetical protein